MHKMRKIINLLTLIAIFAAANMAKAQNKVTVIYEENSGNKGKVEWTRSVEVDDAAVGQPKKIQIPFKNISNEPLKILSAKTHCGCIEAIAPTDSIAPGATGFIEVVYTAKPRTEMDANGFDKIVPPPFTFYQIIDVTTNFDTKNTVLLSVQGTVIK